MIHAQVIALAWALDHKGTLFRFYLKVKNLMSSKSAFR